MRRRTMQDRVCRSHHETLSVGFGSAIDDQAQPTRLPRWAQHGDDVIVLEVACRSLASGRDPEDVAIDAHVDAYDLDAALPLAQQVSDIEVRQCGTELVQLHLNTHEAQRTTTPYSGGAMQCDYFDSDRCRSCTLMGTPYATQLAQKDARVREILARQIPGEVWSEPFASAESGFRNKAKLAVGGSVREPTVGILDRGGLGVDLRDCGIHEAGLREVLPLIAAFISHANLEPYHLASRRGELKNLLVTLSPTGELMLRFVLRSQESIARIRKHLPTLRESIPQLRVVSANILPEHRAVLEGELEIALTEQQTMPMQLSAVTVHLRPQSFFQTNTAVADALYTQATEWCREVDPHDIWDLYCGVGGFGLHLAAAGRRVVGVESSAEAITSARISAADLPGELEFVVGDATAYAARETGADLVVVNPPRRGIGDLADHLQRSDVRTVVYSSCNAESLANDLARMPDFQPTRARMFDMFPQTWHQEVLVLLQRRPN